MTIADLELALADIGANVLPDDAREFLSAAPDGAPLDGSGPTLGLPLESARTPDVEAGLSESDRQAVISEAERLTAEAAKVPQHISVAGLHLIESFEGFSPTVYFDSVGVRTIGYGTTEADVSPLPTHLTRAEAETLLRRKLVDKYEPSLRGLGVPLNQHQFDALCSFVYNLGPGSMSASWTIGRLLRARDYRGAADALLMYDRAGGVVLAGLLRRRRAERALFLEPFVPADPHHLHYFPDHTWTINGQQIPERGTVAEFYRLLEHKRQHERRLHVLQGEIVLLRKRVWRVAHENPKHPTWGFGHRGFRWGKLLDLSREHL